MSRRQRAVLWAEAALLVAMFTFPPYFGVDGESAGRIHAHLGYFPVWNPPSPAAVREALEARYPEAQLSDRGTEGVASGLNRVRLTMNVAASLVVSGALLYLLRQKAVR